MTPVVSFTGAEWRGRVGDSWAAEWARTDRSFAELTERLVDALAAAVPAGAVAARFRVLDIGCGAGETALRLVQRRSDLDVVGLDLSDALVDVARDRSGHRRNPVFMVGDAAGWRDDAPFDAALSRHGVMFFDDPQGAFEHLRGLMRPGGPLVFTCFAARDDNPWATEIAALIGAPLPADPDAPGPFAFANPDRVERMLLSAGWHDMKAECIGYRYVAGSGADPVADAYDFLSHIGPAARHIATLDAAVREALKPRLETWLEANVDGDNVSLPASAWLWRATA